MRFKASVKTQWNGAMVMEAFRRGGGQGVRMAANTLLWESQKLVPLDQGPLKNSGTVDQEGGYGLRATVSFDTPYAVEQHENMKYSHQRGRSAKYLEKPVNDKGLQSQILENIHDGLDATLR